jgi:hypothetical protein
MPVRAVIGTVLLSAETKAQGEIEADRTSNGSANGTSKGSVGGEGTETASRSGSGLQ